MSKQDASPGEIKTARRVFDILELAKEAGGVTPSDVVSELDVAKSTAHRYLTTLEDIECMTRDGMQFHLGLGFIEYATAARNRFEYLDTVESTLEALAEETGEKIWFVAEEHGKAIFLSKEEGANALQANKMTGKPAPLHATAAGKAILANLAETRVDEIPLQEYTEATISNRESLREELARTRETKVAYNDMESVPGLRGVGSPVLVDGEVLGAISIAGPAERISDAYFEEELPALLRRATNELELNLSDPDY